MIDPNFAHAFRLHDSSLLREHEGIATHLAFTVFAAHPRLTQEGRDVVKEPQMRHCKTIRPTGKIKIDGCCCTCGPSAWPLLHWSLIGTKGWLQMA